MAWQFKQPKVLEYEPRALLPGLGDGESVDVSSFNSPRWVIIFEVRRTVELFGLRIWTGKWKPMQMVAP